MSTHVIDVHRSRSLSGIDFGTEPSFSVIPRIALGFSLIAGLVFGLGGWGRDDGSERGHHGPRLRRRGASCQGRAASGWRRRRRHPRAGWSFGDGQSGAHPHRRRPDARAELDIVQGQIVELSAKKARLLAERDGARSLGFPAALSGEDPDTRSIVEGEIRLFNGNLASRDSQRQQLELQIGQVTEEIAGLVKHGMPSATNSRS